MLDSREENKESVHPEKKDEVNQKPQELKQEEVASSTVNSELTSKEELDTNKPVSHSKEEIENEFVKPSVEISKNEELITADANPDNEVRLENVEEPALEEVVKPSKDELKEEDTTVKTITEEENLEKEISKPESVSNAADKVESIAPKSTEKEESNQEIPFKNYDDLSLEVLVTELEQLMKKYEVQQINNHVNKIKSSFNKKFAMLLAEKKEIFLAEGGNSIDFQFSSPIKTKYNSLLSDFKKKRDTYYSNLEKTFNDNYQKRLQVIEDIKKLIEEADSRTMYKSFRELQNVWKSIGPIPKSKYNDIWRTYHHHVERFYDLLHLSNDYRELDFKNNLEEKLLLIKQAEDLQKVEDVDVAFKELQKLHKVWKEDLGPVAKEIREEIWQKFSAATKKVHDRRHEYFRNLKSQYQEIIEKKLAVVKEIETYDFSENQTHSDWQKSIKIIETLRDKYFAVGKLPYAKSEPIWQKFKSATRKFNQQKNVFYKNEKSSQQENLKKKLELIKLAESLKESEDWENTANTLKKIQSDWKKIGHVPRRSSDQVWKNFKEACNYFFDRYHQQKNQLSPEQQEIVDKKKAILEEVVTAKKTTKEFVIQHVKNWSDLGRLPRDARYLEGKFNKAIDALLAKLDMDKNEVSMIKFTNLVNGYLETENYRKLHTEAQFVRKKIDEITKEIRQLENNLGFISNASEENPMFKNVLDRIEAFKNDQGIWKQKLAYLKKLDY